MVACFIEDFVAMYNLEVRRLGRRDLSNLESLESVAIEPSRFALGYYIATDSRDSKSLIDPSTSASNTRVQYRRCGMTVRATPTIIAWKANKKRTHENAKRIRDSF